MVGGPIADGKAWRNDDERRLAFGRLLAEALKTRGMKQEDLARRLGTTQSSVSGWINGKYEPAAATVFGIEKCLSLEPGTLSRPLGYLPVEPASRSISIEGAIAQNTLLDEDQKAALTTMYRVLVRRAGSPTTAGTERPRSQPATTNRSRVAAPASAGPVRRSVSGGR